MHDLQADLRHLPEPRGLPALLDPVSRDPMLRMREFVSHRPVDRLQHRARGRMKAGLSRAPHRLGKLGKKNRGFSLGTGTESILEAVTGGVKQRGPLLFPVFPTAARAHG